MDEMYTKLKKLKEKADYAYFNTGVPIMTDEEYDGLQRKLDSLSVAVEDVEDASSKSIGASPPEHLKKIQLPVHMGSLTKHNDDEKLNNFLTKFNHKTFVVQEKLDGVSCLITYVSSTNCTNLYTRGNGSIGTDITHLIDCGLKIPQSIKCVKEDFMVRGELIISRDIFKDKYSAHFKNIRNMVSGQLSKKNPSKDIIQDIDFVSYEVITTTKFQQSAVKQLKFLKKCGFKVVNNRVIQREQINQEVLMDYLNRRKKKSLYEIDGLVVTIDGEYTRNNAENPKYAFAFKIQGETAEVKVNCIKWNLSKSGKYKPQIFIEPVVCSGVTISSLTGFNAKYIAENKICCGTTLLITRSGDVIPHIIAVLDGCGTPELPDNSRWDSVDLYHNFEQTPDQVIVKQMVHFFTSLKCLNCKDKTILKIFNAGYNTIESVVALVPDQLSGIEGIGDTLASKLINSIQTRIREATVHELLAALNSFGEGIGLKKIQNIDINNPHVLIKGLSETTLKEKILPVWETSLNRVYTIKKLVGADFASNDDCGNNGYLPLLGEIFVFTGFRDASTEKQIEIFGGKVTSAISKKTTCLVVNSEVGKTSTKSLKAQSLGIKTITKIQLLDRIKKLIQGEHKPEIDYDSYSSSEEEH